MPGLIFLKKEKTFNITAKFGKVRDFVTYCKFTIFEMGFLR